MLILFFIFLVKLKNTPREAKYAFILIRMEYTALTVEALSIYFYVNKYHTSFSGSPFSIFVFKVYFDV